jgi:signal transduction histidine kinase
VKRPSSLPVLVPVAALAALAVVMSQAVAFAVIVLAPEPRPAGFSLMSAAAALQGQPAKTSDGRTLERRLAPDPIVLEDRQRNDLLAAAIGAALAQRIGVPVEHVKVRIERRGPPRIIGPRSDRGPGPGMRQGMGPVPGGGPGPGLGWPGDGGPPPRDGQSGPPFRSVDGAPGPQPTPAESARRQANVAEMTRQFSLLADRVTFDPFSASLRLPDGQWATVVPPHGLVSPWQMRLLASLLISMLILAPIVWWLARRLTRPIRVFAEAAERLGADPDAAPLKPTGPTEVRTAIGAFNDMQASLRDLMRRRTQTIAAIAHDLRTPLTRIRFRVELAPPNLRDKMVADVEEMDALIGQAMAFVRGETQAERREPLDLDALARDCAAGFSETGAPVGFDGTGMLAVDGDPAALRRAIANLIENAVKYADAARVRTFALDGQAVISVEDDGPGLPDDELEAVFEPFARGERSRNRETGGAGLGLSVARQAARAGGGDVILINRPEGGLTAILTLPLGSAPI